jgi:hypothetical protein
MKIKLSWVEKTHIEKLNKDVLECNGTDGQGNPVKFSIWSDFPGFNEINAASEIEGNLWNKPGTDKWTLYPLKPQGGANKGQSGGFKAGMKEMVKEKQEGIKLAQENKENGIKVSSTMRMAVDVVIATLANEKIIDESIIKGEISKWRAWLWEEWEKPNDNPIYPE